MSLFTPQRVQASIWIGLGLLLLFLMYLLAPVLAPFALAAIIAYLIAPGVDWLARHRIPRWLAVLMMILLALLIVFGLLLILIPVFRQEMSALQAQLPNLINKLNSVVAPKLAEWFNVTIQFDAQFLRQLFTDQVAGQEDVIATVASHLRSGGVALLGVLGTLLLVPVVLFYLLLDFHVIRDRFEELIPRRWHAQTTSFLAETDGLLSQFLRGQLSVMLALAVYYSVGLAFTGSPTALPIGILTGLLAFIPYVGYALGLTLALLAAILQFESWSGIIAVGVVYGLGQVIESFFLTPRLVGERIGLHPLAVIFALLAFGQVFGFFGVLLALPASAVLLVGLKRLRAVYLASEFYRQA
ncbi:MAG TPA: AI-2E family transporter [Burkholderiaceae bacterium]|nr:AI-2E family transporter [Burkholderiaceae bacterium]